jgi:hypothetical protein
LKFLKRQNGEKGREEPDKLQFSRLQRQAVENYLLGLVRAVVSLTVTIISIALKSAYRCSILLRTFFLVSSKFPPSSFISHPRVVTRLKPVSYRFRVYLVRRVHLLEKALVGERRKKASGVLSGKATWSYKRIRER